MDRELWMACESCHARGQSKKASMLFLISHNTLFAGCTYDSLKARLRILSKRPPALNM
jgi:hypothetical protein